MRLTCLFLRRTKRRGIIAGHEIIELAALNRNMIAQGSGGAFGIPFFKGFKNDPMLGQRLFQPPANPQLQPAKRFQARMQPAGLIGQKTVA